MIKQLFLSVLISIVALTSVFAEEGEEKKDKIKFKQVSLANDKMGAFERWPLDDLPQFMRDRFTRWVRRQYGKEYVLDPVAWNQDYVPDYKAIAMEFSKHSETSSMDSTDNFARALNVLRNRAYLPEMVSLQADSATPYYFDLSDNVGKTFAIAALYKVLGEYAFHNIMVDTFSWKPIGSERWKERYEDYVYISANLTEGYLYQALDDGIIRETEINEHAMSWINTFASGWFNDEKVFDQEVTLADIKNGEAEPQPRSFDMTNTGATYAFNYTPAFINDDITVLDFLSLSKRAMLARGESVLSTQEQEYLTQVIGANIPYDVSKDTYDTILFHTSKGIISKDSYSGLYDKLTYSTLYTLLTRIYDEDSRLTFKEVVVPFKGELDKDYIPVGVTTQPTGIEVTPVNNKGRLTMFIPAGFKNKVGKQHIPELQSDSKLYFGYTEKDLYYNAAKRPYYKIIIPDYNSVPTEFLPSNLGGVGEPKKKIQIGSGYSIQNPYAGAGVKSGNLVYEATYDDKKDYTYYIQNKSYTTSQFTKTNNGIEYIPYDEAPKERLNPKWQLVEFKTMLKYGEEFNITGKKTQATKASPNMTSASENTDVYQKGEPDDYGTYTYATYMPYSNKEEYRGMLLSKINYLSMSDNNDIGFVRRSDLNDGYVSEETLTKKLRYTIERPENKTYPIKMSKGSNSIIINKKTNSNDLYAINNEGVMYAFSELEPIKTIIVNQVPTLYYHSSIFNSMLYDIENKEQTEMFLTTNAVWSIGETKKEEDTKNLWKFKRELKTPFIPLKGDGRINEEGVLYIKESNPSGIYLDLTKLNPVLRNYYIVYDIKGNNNVIPYIINMTPKFNGMDAPYYDGVLDKVFEAFELNTDTVKKLDDIMTSFIEVQTFKNLDTTTLNKAYVNVIDNAGKTRVVTNQVIFDPVTYKTFLKLEPYNDPTDSFRNLLTISRDASFSPTKEVSIPNLPYSYKNDTGSIEIVWLNGRYGRDFKLDESFTKIDGIENLPQTTSGEIASFPNPILNIVNKLPKDEKEKKEEKVDDKEQTVVVEGIITSTKPSEISNQKGQITTTTTLPKNIIKFLTNNSALGKDSIALDRAELRKLHNYNGIIFGSAFPNFSFTFSDESDIGSGTNSNFIGENIIIKASQPTIDDILTEKYLKKEEESEKYNESNSILYNMEFVIVYVIPKLFTGILTLYHILMLLANVTLFKRFCRQKFDYVKFLTFGYRTIDDISIVRTSINCAIAVTLLALTFNGQLLEAVYNFIK